MRHFLKTRYFLIFLIWGMFSCNFNNGDRFKTYILPFNVDTVELNKQTGNIMPGSNFMANWSPDGQYLAYIKEDRKAASPWQLTIQDLNTHTERALGNSLNLAMNPCWSPDGKSIIVIGRDKNQVGKNKWSGIFQIDVKTGNTKEILLLSDYKYNKPDDAASPISGIEWSLDGKSIFYLFFKDRLVKHNLKTGEDKILCTDSNFNYCLLDRSPDGKSLLFGIYRPEEKKSYLYSIPVEGGEEKELCTSQKGDQLYGGFWTPDGKYVFFTEDDEGTSLWRVAATGGIPTKVYQSKDRAEFFSIHPDGNQISFALNMQYSNE